MKNLKNRFLWEGENTMQKITPPNLFYTDIALFTYVRRIGVVILVLIAFLCDASFAQLKDLFKSIDGVALWGSIGGFHHNEIKTQRFIFPNASLRYGAELLLGPFPDSTINPSYEFGLGVNFADGYRTNIGDLDIRMPIRTIYIAAYLEFQKPCWLPLSPYVGSKIGTNFDLKGSTLNATASTDTSNLFELTGNTIPIEILVGGWCEPTEGFNIFIEMSYEYLAFNGIVYKALSTSTLPSRRSHRIDLSSWYFTLGFQLANTNR